MPPQKRDQSSERDQSHSQKQPADVPVSTRFDLVRHGTEDQSSQEEQPIEINQSHKIDLVRQGRQDQTPAKDQSDQQPAPELTEEQAHVQRQETSPLRQAEERFRKEVDHFNQTFEQAKQSMDKEIEQAIKQLQETTEPILTRHQEHFNTQMQESIKEHSRQVSEIVNNFEQALEQIQIHDTPSEIAIQMIQQARDQARQKFHEEVTITNDTIEFTMEEITKEANREVSPYISTTQKTLSSSSEKLGPLWRDNCSTMKTSTEELRHEIDQQRESIRQSGQRATKDLSLSSHTRQAQLASARAMHADINMLDQEIQQIYHKTIHDGRFDSTRKNIYTKIMFIREQHGTYVYDFEDHIDEQRKSAMQKITEEQQQTIDRFNKQAENKIKAIKEAQQQAAQRTEKQSHLQGPEIHPIHQAEERFNEEINHFNQAFEQAQQTANDKTEKIIQNSKKSFKVALIQHKEDFYGLLKIHLDRYNRRIAETESLSQQILNDLNSINDSLDITTKNIQISINKTQQSIDMEAENAIANLTVLERQQRKDLEVEGKKQKKDTTLDLDMIPQGLKDVWETSLPNITQHVEQVNREAQKTLQSQEQTEKQTHRPPDNNRSATLKSLFAQLMRADIKDVQQRTLKLSQETIHSERLDVALQEIKQTQNRRIQQFDAFLFKQSKQLADELAKRIKSEIQAIKEAQQQAIKRIHEQAQHSVRTIKKT